MRNPFLFFVETFQQPRWVSLWVCYMIMANLASVAFWDEPLARLVFVTFMVTAVLMLTLYSYFGYEKILGLGHILWIPLLIYLLTQLDTVSGLFANYLLVLTTTLAISLAFDITDVWKYFSQRKET